MKTVENSMSGGIVMRSDAAPGLAILPRGCEHIGPREPQEHQPSMRDANVPPLRHGPNGDIAKLRDFRASAQCVNDLVRVHDTNLSALRKDEASTVSIHLLSMLSMKTLYTRLLEVCRDQGIVSPIGRDIERIAGVSSGRVTQIKQEGEAARPGPKTIALLSRLGYAPDWIREGKGKKFAADALRLSGNTRKAVSALDSSLSAGPSVKGRVPLISWVQAGVWNDAVDIYEPGYAEQWLPILQNGGDHSYALRVDGDSMTAAYGKTYPDGTIIIVNPDQRSPSSGQRIIAKLKGGNKVTFKVYVEEDGRRWLKPLNPMHPPIHDEFEVIGTVIAKYEPD